MSIISNQIVTPFADTYVIRDASTKQITDIRADIPLKQLEDLGQALNDTSDHGFFPNVKPGTTVYCMSDIHGDAPMFQIMLQHLTGLISLETRANKLWFHYTPPNKPYHVLVVGDILDTLRSHGAFTTIGERDEIDILMMFCSLRIMSDGKFRFIFGNHEIMNLTGDYRFAETNDIETRRRGFQYPTGRFLRLLKLARPYGCVVVGKNLYVHGGITHTFLQGLKDKTGSVDIESVVRVINNSALRMITIMSELANDPIIKQLDRLYYEFRKGRTLADDPDQWVQRLYVKHGSGTSTEYSREEKRLVLLFIKNYKDNPRLEQQYAELRSQIMWLRYPLVSYIYAYQSMMVSAEDVFYGTTSHSIVWNRDMSCTKKRLSQDSICDAAESSLQYLNDNSRHKIRTFVLGHSPQYNSQDKIRVFRTIVKRTKHYVSYKPTLHVTHKTSKDKTKSYVTGHRCGKQYSIVLLVDTGCSESFWQYHDQQVLPQILCIHHTDTHTEERTVRVSCFHKNQNKQK